MSRRGMRRGLIGVALVAGLVVPAVRSGTEMVAPARKPESPTTKNVEPAPATAQSAAVGPQTGATEAALPPADAGQASATATEPSTTADPTMLALAPTESPRSGALGAIDHATPQTPAPSPSVIPHAAAPQLDAVTQAVLRFAEPVDAPPLALDAEQLRAAAAAYRVGDLATGDARARALSDPSMKLAAEWAAIRLQPRKVGLKRLRAFQAEHEDWPSSGWIERRIEEAMYGDRKDGRAVLEFFAKRSPETLVGEIALARAEMALGREDAATQRVRRMWREETLAGGLEQVVERDFGARLTSADHKARSDLMFYDGKHAASLAAAKAAGPDALKLATARAAVGTKRYDALAAALPKEAQSDPSLIFARAQALAGADKFAEAAQLLTSAPSDPALLVDGDAWWAERRRVARKLLDAGDAATAYAVAAAGGAKAASGRVEASFMAGWIALRHMSRSREDAQRARTHFDAAAAVATTPASSARAAYWQGRAAEALGETDNARAAYGVAARRVSTFYGQLAAAKLGMNRPKLRQARAAAQDTDFTLAFRALYDSNERALALPLALDAAKAGGRDGELAALSDWIGRRRDARAALAIGKAALAAGGSLDEMAFPTYGVPAFKAVPNSAEAAVVYSIARQESAFQPEAVSRAGAKGLMQMLDSTARETAKRAGLPFDVGRMLADPAFNAQLGAAHLGTLLSSQKGSYVLAFAAYNAGPGRVREWLQTYGDPREAGVDAIDWIERIPFTETRDYVQKTIENLQIYRLRLGERSAITIEADLKRGAQAAAR